MECADIYEDLHNTDLGEKITQLQEEKKKLIEHIKSLQNDISKLCKELTEMKETEGNLKKNISELYNTAKVEIGRKDRMISELREELDNVVFRRKSKFKFNNETRERSLGPFKRARSPTEVVSNKRHNYEKVHELPQNEDQRYRRCNTESREQSRYYYDKRNSSRYYHSQNKERRHHSHSKYRHSTSDDGSKQDKYKSQYKSETNKKYDIAKSKSSNVDVAHHDSVDKIDNCNTEKHKYENKIIKTETESELIKKHEVENKCKVKQEPEDRIMETESDHKLQRTEEDMIINSKIKCELEQDPEHTIVKTENEEISHLESTNLNNVIDKKIETDNFNSSNNNVDVKVKQECNENSKPVPRRRRCVIKIIS